MPRASNKEKVIKSIPDAETKWVKQIQGDKVFCISSDKMMDTFYLYLEVDDGYIKIGSAKNPLDFDDVIKNYK